MWRVPCRDKQTRVVLCNAAQRADVGLGLFQGGTYTLSEDAAPTVLADAIRPSYYEDDELSETAKTTRKMLYEAASGVP